MEMAQEEEVKRDFTLLVYTYGLYRHPKVFTLGDHNQSHDYQFSCENSVWEYHKPNGDSTNSS